MYSYNYINISTCPTEEAEIRTTTC